MRRVTCLIVVFMLVFCIAAQADSYDDLKTSYNSGRGDISITLSVPNPEAITKLFTAYEEDGYGIFGFSADWNEIISSIANTKCVGVFKFNANDTFEKLQLSYEINSVVPLKLNKNMSFTGEFKAGMWINADLSDEMNPKFEYIFSSPASSKYMKLDLIESIRNSGGSAANFASEFKKLIAKSRSDEMQSKLVDILRNNSTITSVKGSKAVIRLSDKQMQNYIGEVLEYMSQQLNDNSGFEELTSGEYGIGDFSVTKEDVDDFFDEYSIFAKDAYTIEISRGRSNVITSNVQTVNFSIDLSEISDGEEDGTIDFSVSAAVNLSGLNSNIKVEYPVLTDENTIDIGKMTDNWSDGEWGTDNCNHDEYVWIETDYIYSADSDIYVDLRDVTRVMSRYGYTTEDITSSAKRSGYEYETDMNGNNVILSEKSGKERFKTVQITLDTPNVIIDGEAYTAGKNAFSKDGHVYVDYGTIQRIFGFDDIDYCTVDLDENKLQLSVERRSPLCHHTDEEIAHWYDDDDGSYYDNDYFEYNTSMYTYSQMPYSGIEYVSLGDVVGSTYWNNEKNATYATADYKTFTLTDNTGLEKFKTFSVTDGSDILTMDGEQIKMKSPAKVYKGDMYLDTDAIKTIFGYKTKDAWLDYRDGYYDDEKDEYIEQKGFFFRTELERKPLDK